MHIAFCDDDLIFLRQIENYFDKINIKTDYEMFSSGEKLLNAYNDNHVFDAIFLDMEMSGLNGIETANKIREKDNGEIIVFITSHDEYMQEAFRCEPSEFLVKPVEYDKFAETFDFVYKKWKKRNKTVVIQQNKSIIRIRISDITYIESSDHYIYVHTVFNDSYKLYKTISQFINDTFSNSIVRIHKSYAINLEHLISFENNEAALQHCDRKIPVSRNFKKGLSKNIYRYKEEKFGL